MVFLKRCIAILLLAIFQIVATSEVQAQQSIVELTSADKLIEATGYTGVILIYDAQQDSFLASNASMVRERLIPASTFKIFSSLVALQTGAISSINAVIEWDGVVRSRSEINRDMDLKSAFRVSAVPHYQHLVRTIGEEQMQYYIDQVEYGNRDLSGGIDLFWLTGGLRISPIEQIRFLTRLYRGELPFLPDVMNAVKEMMVYEVDDNLVIRAKTGWAVTEEVNNTGWWIGWIEKEERFYAFATVLKTTLPGDNFGDSRLSITKDVLRLLEILDADE